jgi:hypothetical protein
MTDIKEKIDLIKKIDFGSIDGLYDKHLPNYFLDDNYWERLVNGKEFFVIGRKGTGKSAIYSWLYDQQFDKGVLIENSSFKSFPFERLLKLSDDDFTRPNQYQSIWRNIILTEFAALIIRDDKNQVDEEWKQLQQYVEYRFGKDLTELHKKVTTSTNKTEFGLQIKGIGGKTESNRTIEFGDGFENISMINRKLENIISSYLKRNPTTKYILQFDQLDDNYTSYVSNDKYFQAIISLFKVIYDLNLTADRDGLPTKVIAYLRSDIFYEINSFDPESSRWDSYKYHLNWSIINKSDWFNPGLLRLINLRIKHSVPSIKSRSEFNFLFFEDDLKLMDGSLKMKPFKYIVHRTFHRPRDFVQFCIKIQDEIKKTNQLDHRTIYNAEKEYSLWLLTEISNEIGTQLTGTKTLFVFLRQLGEKPFTKKDFTTTFLSGRNKNINKSPEALMRFLYRLGILYNVNINKGTREFYSIIRNERSELDDNMKMQLHSGILKGLHTYVSGE